VKKTAGIRWKEYLLENGSYKLVALFVTLILWVTILGRRDFVLNRELDVEFLVPRTIAVSGTGANQRVSVKVSGPRMALKKFAQNPGSVTIDLGRHSEPGPVRAVVSPRMIEVPFGVKVISVTPEEINVTLVRTGGEEAPAPTSDFREGN